jgi:predicted membrane-bound spermidine synthase
MKPALGLAFLSGFVALSYEIVWFRAYAFLSAGAAPVFGLLLGMVLLGLAAGAAASGRFCREGLSGALVRFIVLANVLGYLLVPGVARLLTLYETVWTWTLPLVAVVSFGMGTLFPLVSHAAVPPDGRAGARVAGLYFANVLGSTAGSLLTGFVLADLWPLRTIALVLLFIGLAMGALAPFLPGARGTRPPLLPVAGVAGIAVVALALHGPLYDGLYERMQHRFFYRPGFRFAHVVENRSGVITVSPDGTFFGGGWYDGAVNTALEPDRNGVLRAYAVSGLHARPREVLIIGLSTGSWASVVAENPEVERVTVVEINPGYLELVPRYPEVAGVLRNPKVQVEIDDVRRWLVRRRDRRFDLIVSNTTAPWRSSMSNLLSREFLELARSRMNDGGVLFYGTFGSPRLLRTGLGVFPHGISIGGMLAVSDRPVAFDEARWKGVLGRHLRQGRPLLDAGSAEGRALLERLGDRIRSSTQTRETILSRVGGAEEITDDNMGTEWTDYPVR